MNCAFPKFMFKPICLQWELNSTNISLINLSGIGSMSSANCRCESISPSIMTHPLFENMLGICSKNLIILSDACLNCLWCRHTLNTSFISFNNLVPPILPASIIMSSLPGALFLFVCQYSYFIHCYMWHFFRSFWTVVQFCIEFFYYPQ